MGNGQAKGTVLVAKDGRGGKGNPIGGVVVEKRGNDYYVLEVIYLPDSRLSGGTIIGRGLLADLIVHHGNKGTTVAVYPALANSLKGKVE